MNILFININYTCIILHFNWGWTIIFMNLVTSKSNVMLPQLEWDDTIVYPILRSNFISVRRYYEFSERSSFVINFRCNQFCNLLPFVGVGVFTCKYTIYKRQNLVLYLTCIPLCVHNPPIYFWELCNIVLIDCII